MKIRLPKTRRYRVYLYILSILIILLAIDLILVRIGRRITIGHDTTRITTPLKPDGTPDYLAVIDAQYSTGVTSDNNAAPLFLQAFGPTFIPTPINPAPIYARFNMPPLPQDGPYYISFEQYLKKLHPGKRWFMEKQEDQGWYRLDAALTRPWKSADDPELAAWLDSIAVPLAALREASLRPRYFMPPIVSENNTDRVLLYILVPSSSWIQNAAYAFSARAMLYAAQGEFDKAREDLLTLHRLANLLGQDFTLFGWFQGTSITHTACKTEQTLASSGLLTADQLRTLLLDLNALAPFPDIAQTIDVQRYGTLDALIHCSRRPKHTHYFIAGSHSESDTSKIISFWLSPKLYPSNFNRALRLANEHYDRLAAAAGAATYAESKRLANAVDEDVVKRKPVDPLTTLLFDPAQTLLDNILPSFVSSFSIHRNMLVRRDLTRLALALALFHAEYRVYPDSLAALAPDYLPVVPEDCFIDAPFRYVKTPGGYLLYTVGSYMTDDGARMAITRNLAVLVGPYPEE
ncbi:MAG: hypothetical protein FWD53_12695 [Phycisphaerales bacterium]|nr:hypothetical protein [Phycisphaerales bacterium]